MRMRMIPKKWMAIMSLSFSSSSSLSSSSSSSSIRVLCLHGKGESSASFHSLLSPLIQHCHQKKLNIEWILPNGTFPCFPLQPEEGFSWWNLPPNTRSFTTSQYIGVEETLRRIETELYPVDVIFGFSQGAILASVLLMRGLLSSSSSSLAPKRAILCGASWPNPYSQDMSKLANKAKPPLNILHVIGEQDNVNPPELAVKLHEVLGGRIVTHPGRHVVPLEPNFLDLYVALIMNKALPHSK